MGGEGQRQAGLAFAASRRQDQRVKGVLGVMGGSGGC